jgi:hypothetical protein
MLFVSLKQFVKECGDGRDKCIVVVELTNEIDEAVDINITLTTHESSVELK